MEMSEVVRLLFVALTAMGGGVGLTKLLTVKSTNTQLEALAKKSGIEATDIFTDSVLKVLNTAQATADRATKRAEEALEEAEKCREELAFLRRWIINQGLIPPERINKWTQ